MLTETIIPASNPQLAALQASFANEFNNEPVELLDPVLNAIFEEALAPYRVNPLPLFEAHTKPATRRPSDDDLLHALVFYFGASEVETLDWIEGMDIETMRELMTEEA